MKNKKGFTLIELLAVIVILGLLMAIAIPSVTKYITESRKKTVVSTIGNYITAMVNEVNDLTYTFTGNNTIYAVPIECIALERGGTNPFGAWHQASNAYWAYVLVQYDDETSSYRYGYTFKDSAGYGLYPTAQSKLNEQGKQIQTGLELTKPKNGKVTNITAVDNWSGFSVDSSTNLVVLKAESEGNPGNGETTCTLVQKGTNYDQVEEEKYAEIEASEGTEGTLVNAGSSTNAPIFGHSSLLRAKIEEVHFLDNKRVPSNAIEWWDASVEKNLSIKAWTLDNDGDNLYELYIGQKGGVTAPVDCSNLFYSFSKATLIDVTHLDTSNTTDMTSMFTGTGQVTGLSNFDTSNVTSMKQMFAMNGSKSLDLSNFNTSKVTNMASMFMLNNIDTFDVSNFDTSNVTDMGGMFAHSSKVTALDLSNFNTSKVTSMNAMFSGATKITTLNLSSFNTSNVTDMSSMFTNMDSMTSLNLSNFNTSKVTNMRSMFSYMDNLQTVNLSSFNTSNVTDMMAMFMETPKLTTLNLSTFNTNKVTNMQQMFYKSSVGTVTTGSNFKTPKVTEWGLIFNEANNIVITIPVMTTSTNAWQICSPGAATASTARITLNYTSAASSNVSDIIWYCGNSYSGIRISKGSRISG